MFVYLCFTSHQQRGHLETTPIYCPESNTGPSRGSPLRYRCATQATLLVC